MAINIDTETITEMREAGKYVPGKRKPSRATLFRWWLNGLLVAGTDERVMLETVKLNGIRCTSVEAIGRFLRAANGQSAVPTITPKQRQRMAEAADRMCAAKGF